MFSNREREREGGDKEVRQVHRTYCCIDILTGQMKATDSSAFSLTLFLYMKKLFLCLCSSSPPHNELSSLKQWHLCVGEVFICVDTHFFRRVGLVTVAWPPVISHVWCPDPERPRDKAAWLRSPVQSHGIPAGMRSQGSGDLFLCC